MEQGTNSGGSVQSNSIRDRVAQAYYSHGLFCSSHPYSVIFVTVAILVVCCYPLSRLPLLGSSSQHFKTSVSDFTPPSTHPSDSEEYAFTNPRWFQGYPVGFIQQIVVKSAVLPWKSNFILTDAFRAPLAESFHIRELINNHQVAHGSNHTVTLSDICLQVSEPIDELASGVLPHFGCFLLSPTNIWKHDLTQFQQDDNIVKAVFSLKDSTLDPSSLREIVFGVPWKESGIKQFNVRSRPRVLTYSFTIIFQTLDLQFLHNVFEQLRSKYPSNPYTENTTYFPEESFITHLYFQDLHALSEFVPLGVAYIILFLYIYFSVRKIELVKSKWALAISAVMTVVMSLLMSVGLCLWFGLNPTLNGSEILPYLIVVIGLENMLVLTKSIVSTPDHLDVKLRVAQGLSKEGWSITKNLLTELAMLTVAFLTFVPKIQEFCLFAVVGLFTDFFLQLVFFATFLSIDIRRIEISDLHRNRLLRNINEQNKHDFLFSADSLTKTTLSQSRQMSSNVQRKLSKSMADSSAKVFAPMSNPMLGKLPKRMKFIYFWARTRIVQRGLMISLGIWIIFWAYSSGVIERLSENAVAFVPITGGGIVRPIFQKFTGETNTSEENHSETTVGNGDQTNAEYSPKNVGFRLKHHNLYLWQSMPAQHWTTLFGYYNISLTGRYISILPPLHLSITIDPNTVSELRTPADIETSKRFYWQFLSSVDQGDKDVDDLLPTELTYHPSSPAEVGLAIALTTTTLCFFVYLMVVLYRCMCTKHYAEWRTSWSNSSLSNTDSRRDSNSCQETSDSCLITETLPIALHAHHQEIENIVADSNLIVSSCLNGDICVWDSVSGECITSIKRSNAFIKMRNCAIEGENLVMPNRSDFKTCEIKNEPLPNSSQNYLGGESIQLNHLPFQPTWCMDFCDMCIALGCKDGRLEVWNAFTGNLDYVYIECKSGITAISLSENRLVAARLNGTVDFFTVQVSRKGSNFENVEHGGSHCSQNVLEYVQCSWFHTVKAHTLSVSVLVIDNNFAVTGGFDRLVKVYRSDSAACVYTLHGHSAPISALHIDQSSPLSALSACQDGIICLWDLTTGTCMYSLNGHHGAVMALNCTFIYMISQGTDNRICIWEKCQGHLLHSISQEFSLHSTAVLLTSNVIVTTKEDNLVLWDVNHGEALRMIMVGNGSHSCHIKILRLCGQSIVCDYGPQMFIINFPAIKLD